MISEKKVRFLFKKLKTKKMEKDILENFQKDIPKEILNGIKKGKITPFELWALGMLGGMLGVLETILEVEK